MNTLSGKYGNVALTLSGVQGTETGPSASTDYDNNDKTLTNSTKEAHKMKKINLTETN